MKLRLVVSPVSFVFVAPGDAHRRLRKQGFRTLAPVGRSRGGASSRLIAALTETLALRFYAASVALARRPA